MRRRRLIPAALAVLALSLAAPPAQAAAEHIAPPLPAGFEQVTSASTNRLAAEAWCDICIIQSAHNGRFVAAENGWAGDHRGMLRARTLGNAIGPWEKFSIFRTGNVVTFRSQNSLQYVAEENHWTGEHQFMLRARTPVHELGPWEEFGMAYNSTQKIYLIWSWHNRRFVSMENAFTGDHQFMLRARSIDDGSQGPWEAFRIGRL